MRASVSGPVAQGMSSARKLAHDLILGVCAKAQHGFDDGMRSRQQSEAKKKIITSF